VKHADFGFPEYADPETDGGLEQDLASRRYRALLPEEEYDSDYDN
jgi:Niemann-Pick C1 protein